MCAHIHIGCVCMIMCAAEVCAYVWTCMHVHVLEDVCIGLCAGLCVHMHAHVCMCDMLHRCFS